MGIVLIRVDDRLVHGQIVEAWAPFCKATRVIVASDAVKNNLVQKVAIESCSSKVLAIKVESIAETLRDLILEDMNKERIIIIFSTLKELLQAYNKGFVISNVNIGNIHHRNADQGGREITPSVYIDKEDEGILQYLLKQGVRLDIRAVPSDRPVDMFKAGVGN